MSALDTLSVVFAIIVVGGFLWFTSLVWMDVNDWRRRK